MLKMFLLLLLPLHFYGQSENWDVYMANYEKGPGSTVLNMALKTSAPNKELPYLVVTGVSFTDCSPDGLPTQTQFPELYTIADAVDDIIAKHTKSIHAGTFSYQCERLNYYYVKDTNGIRQLLEDCYATRFPNYGPYINIKEDRSWDAYLSFLYPNDETLEIVGNQKIIFNLTNAGDKLDKPRKVDHWLYFDTEADRSCFLTYSKTNNYRVEDKRFDKKFSKPYSLHISRKDYVDLPTINQITLSLRKEALKCNGEYDGWETFVVK